MVYGDTRKGGGKLEGAGGAGLKELTQAVLLEEDDSEINEERETGERNRLQENSKLERGKGEEARSDFFISQKEWIAALESPMPFTVVSH